MEQVRMFVIESTKYVAKISNTISKILQLIYTTNLK